MWSGDASSVRLFPGHTGPDLRWRTSMVSKLAGALCLYLLATTGEARSAAPFPGFVYLADVVPTIRQDMRYASSHNFIGRPVEGYLANECILTERAAQALARVQAELTARGLSLIVWDCYRPTSAVRDFVNWSKNPGDARMKAEFFPNTDKANFFQQGYLATRSAHSRGSTVDLGIVPNSLKDIPKLDPAEPLKPCTAAKGQRFEDGTIDLGTEHDCLDPQASTIHPNIPKEAHTNRLMLKDAMQRAGFRPYAKEWWHFELIDEQFQQPFDFPVVARGGSPADKPQAGKTKEPPSIGSQWTEFKRAVLQRESGVVASMTKFPLVYASGLLNNAAFVAEFESIFDGKITGCISLQDPEQNPKIGRNAYSLTCSRGGKRTTLNFQTISGNWRLFAIESENDADDKSQRGVERTRPSFEQGSPNAEPEVPNAGRGPSKAERGPTKAERGPPRARHGPSNVERGPPKAERTPPSAGQEQ